MLTVGITVFVRKGERSIWSNGADQNCIFLWMLLRQVPGVGRVVMINGGDGGAPPAGMMLRGLDIEFVKFEEIADQIDVLIEAGAQISAESIAKVHARGGRAVAYKFGNAYVIDAEREIHGKESGAIFNGSIFDEVWTTPQHIATCGSYWETCYRAPLRVMPHIWEPTFVEAAIGEFTGGLTFGYQPEQGKKRVSIFEPNVNIVKTCHIPLLVCEQAYRQAPELLGEIYVTNAMELKKHLAFRHFVANLDIQKNHLCSFEERYNSPFFLAKYTDVVVSHQWENALNYAYYDALYGSYPLIHNSDLLPKGVGYYYSGFDAHEGGRVLTSALQMHDSRLEEYNHAAADFLKTVRVSTPENIDAHARALHELMARPFFL